MEGWTDRKTDDRQTDGKTRLTDTYGRRDRQKGRWMSDRQKDS